MADYFDAYRIDHILGFFRIWEIPAGAVHGLLGQFSPALGMTRQEIEAYGLRPDMERLTQPYITDTALERRFGERAEEVRQTYVERRGEGYAMRPEYATQRKVEAAFAGKDSEADRKLRDGLYALISDVLFVRDRTDQGKFHPRIAAQADLAYAALSDREKTVFNRLYDDYFYRRHNQFWYNEAMRKLPRLALATRMLMCAEDLGMVPECVPWAMNRLHILSLEIQSMPKEAGCRFAHLYRCSPRRSRRKRRYGKNAIQNFFHNNFPSLNEWRFTQKHFGRDRVYTTKACELRRGELEMGF